MSKSARLWAIAGISIVLLIIAGATVVRLLASKSTSSQSQRASAIPVETSPVIVREISEHKTFSATLEASAKVIIAPKIQGRIRHLSIDLGDEVSRGQVIAELDSAEFQQELLLAKAEQAVAEAQLVEARNGSDISGRELTRIQALHDRGIASDAQLDTATTQQLTSESSVKVAEAQVQRALALVEAAQIRFGYASIHADWQGADERRFVSDRFVEEGDTVGANTPIAAIVEIDPIIAVIYVTERDYPALSQGLGVVLTTDAYPGRSWQGSVSRVSPVFREGSRQARVEIRVPNDDRLLKPGMFARVDTILRTVESATVVPAASLLKRDGNDALFVVDTDSMTASLVPVTVGIRDGESVQVTAANLEGRRARDQILASRTTRELQERTAEAEEERFKVASSTALLVAQAQRDLLDAQIAEVEAIISYRIALIQAHLAEGTLLERRRIELP